MAKQFADVDCKFGAPMGRVDSYTPGEACEIFAVNLEDGYDDGGAYWGDFQTLYCVRGEGTEIFVRAGDIDSAIAKIGKAYDLNITQNAEDVSEFLHAFLTCALWSSTDWDTEEPLDKNYDPDDFSPEALASLTEDCQAFQRDHWDLIKHDLSQAGHDFWLTRNRHGAGFNDGDWPEESEKALTDDSHVYGEVNIYVGDNGKLHI